MQNSRRRIPENSTILYCMGNLTSFSLTVTFMVVAWFGAAGIAAIVSRYFKDGFMNSTDMSCGVKPWFQVTCVNLNNHY